MANEKRLICVDDAISKLEDEMFLCAPVSENDGYLDAYKKRVIPKLLRNVMDWLQNQPTVDAVEVVRCKDCEKSHPELCHYKGCIWCARYDRYMNPDDFCSYGERRTDERKVD
jgi:hypothetical protein